MTTGKKCHSAVSDTVSLREIRDRISLAIGLLLLPPSRGMVQNIGGNTQDRHKGLPGHLSFRPASELVEASILSVTTVSKSCLQNLPKLQKQLLMFPITIMSSWIKIYIYFQKLNMHGSPHQWNVSNYLKNFTLISFKYNFLIQEIN